MKERSIEVKVGALILVALVILGGFIVIMGGLNFQATYLIYVDFENPSGLQAGAPVRLAGLKIGKVSEIQFRGTELTTKTSEPPAPIRVVLKIESRYRTAIRENSRFYLTTQGVLGELFLAIEPGSADRPVLAENAVVHGISPPRLDLLLSESYELLHRAYLGLTRNEQRISETFDGLHDTLRGTGDFFKKNGGKLDRIVDNVESATKEANSTLKAARERYVDNPQITRILGHVEHTSENLDKNLGPLLTDAQKIAHALGSDQQLARYDKITANVSEATARANAAAGDAQAILAHVKRGEGTVGALVMDEALYDDLQEMLRDLKHNPWKFFWRQ